MPGSDKCIMKKIRAGQKLWLVVSLDSFVSKDFFVELTYEQGWKWNEDGAI